MNEKVDSLGPIRIFVLVSLLAVVLACILDMLSPVAGILRAGNRLTGIVIGTDLVDYARHSDTIMVASYDPKTNDFDVLSVPRDTRISLPGYKFRRINEVFAYHYSITQNVHKAASALLDAVKQVLSTEGTVFAPKFYVHMDYSGFKNVVNMLGGMQVQIDEPMNYDDNAGNYHFHKERGVYLLDGADALAYVRYRGLSGDRGRMLRQLEFLKNFIKEIHKRLIPMKLPGLFMQAVKSVRTNISVWDMLILALESKHLKVERISPRLLPGNPSGPYWELDAARLPIVVAQLNGRNVSDMALVKESPIDKDRRITVSIWNATRKQGLAKKASRRLRKKGFDVLEWGNYDTRQTRTRVLDRTGNFQAARKVAEALGVDSVFSEINPKLLVEVDVILGDDFR